MSVFGNEGAARAVRSARFPDAEELRMVRAIAMVVLLEAARRGEYRASFHGFRIQAARQRAGRPVAAFVEVQLCVTWDRHPVELKVMRMEPQEASATPREGSEAAEVVGMEPMPGESVWWIESTLLGAALDHGGRAEAVRVPRWLCQPG
jgi:hypothetical protein